MAIIHYNIWRSRQNYSNSARGDMLNTEKPENCSRQHKQQIHLLDRSGQEPGSTTRIRTEKKFGIDENRPIICANCSNLITSPEYIISVDGEHEQAFTNPDGFTYEIGCFSFAKGCLVLGEPTEKDTWFEGFRWSYSTCSGCNMHIGWYYENETESFFGLILDLLANSTDTNFDV